MPRAKLTATVGGSILKLRREQIEALANYSRSTFEDEAFNTLKEIWTDEFDELGEQAVRDLIHMGFDKSDRYEMTSEDEVLRFIHLMMLWGPDFDESLDTAWASQILARNCSASLMLRQLEWKSDQLLNAEESKQ